MINLNITNNNFLYIMDWSPLESNPEVLNQYLYDIGFCTSKYSFHEILCFEDWAYKLVPRPVISVVFLFPQAKGGSDRKMVENEKVRNYLVEFILWVFVLNLFWLFHIRFILWNNMPKMLVARLLFFIRFSIIWN